MKKLEVYYQGWGERWPLGTLADNGADLLFEYSQEALRQGLELSPRRLALRPQAYGQFPAHLQRLPGLIADVLPDGWGMLVMDRLFRKNGLDPAAMSPLDRLAFIDGRAMGALTFEPATTTACVEEDVRLLELAQEAQALVEGRDSVALKRLAMLGGSPHGARPKVLVNYNAKTGELSTGAAQGALPWLVKFQAQAEHKEVCALEDLYAHLARQCLLDMPQTRSFDLDKKLGAFGIARFDVEDGMRVPVHTLAGALGADFRTPSVDYTTFLRATRFFTRDEREVCKAYERAVFNVVFHNRDDHSKNFSYRLGRDRRWRLAPCYDLTFCEGPGGYHQMDVCGEARNVTRAHMQELARQGGVPAGQADDALERALAVAATFQTVARDYAVRPATLRHVKSRIETNLRRLG